MGTNETATILSIFFPVSKQPIFERNKRIIQVIIILSLNTFRGGLENFTSKRRQTSKRLFPIYAIIIDKNRSWGGIR